MAAVTRSKNGKSAAQLRQRDRERLVRTVMDQRFKHAMRGRAVGRAGAKVAEGLLADLLFAGPGEPRLPDEVFPRLRWGGLFVYAGSNRANVQRLAETFDGKRGFVLEQPVDHCWLASLGLRIPGLTPKAWYFAARKIDLIQPGDTTERFTYHVQLQPHEDVEHGYFVAKEVPTFEDILGRLRKRCPDLPDADLAKRAHKLVDHVFPTFLTREVAVLKILQRDLPEEYRCRVPKVLGVEKDDRGMVRKLAMNWLRNGGEPISQLEFARQAAELLTALHDAAKVIHLDLRLDNFVITPDGVGFVDFGSSVRIGEDLSESPMLTTLFEEMMRTSQIQRMLGRMVEKGHVTSQCITDVHGKVDKTVDSFYLAVQINKPHANPEFRQLVVMDKDSHEANALAALTAAILRPKHPEKAEFKTSADILRGIRRIEHRLFRPAHHAA